MAPTETTPGSEFFRLIPQTLTPQDERDDGVLTAEEMEDVLRERQLPTLQELFASGGKSHFEPEIDDQKGPVLGVMIR